MASTATIRRGRTRRAHDLANPLPSDVPGLVMWQRADQGVFTDLGVTPAQNGQAVQQWSDLSGNGNHLIRNVGGGATVGKNSAIGGQTALSFNTTSSYAPAGNIWPVASGRTQVFIWRSTITSPGALSSGLSSAAATHALYISAGLETLYTAGSGVQSVNALSQAGTLAANTNYSTIERYSGVSNTSVVYRNGVVAMVTAQDLIPPLTATTDLAMQVGVYKTNSVLWTGLMAEVMLFNRSLNDTEIARINRYINNRYGIAPVPPKPLLIFTGNSLTWSQNCTTGSGSLTGTAYPAVTMANIGSYGNYSAVNMGVQAMTTQQDLLHGNYSIDPIFPAGVGTKGLILYWELTNTLTNVVTGVAGQTQAISDTIAYCLARRARGWRVFVGTCLPRANIAQFETDRQAVNTYIRSNWPSFADGLMDVGNDATIGAAGAQNNAVYFNPTDLTHLTDPGYAIVAAYATAAITGQAFVAPPAPGVRAVSSAANWLGTTGMATPAAAVAGDTLVVTIANATGGALTPGTGWTQTGTSGTHIGSGVGTYYVFTKTAAGGAETFTLSGSGSGNNYSGICAAVTKGTVDAATYGDSHGAATSTTVTAPASTATGTTDVGISIYQFDGVPTVTAPIVPVYQLAVVQFSTTLTILMGWQQLAAAGSWTPNSTTLGTAQFHDGSSLVLK